MLLPHLARAAPHLRAASTAATLAAALKAGDALRSRRRRFTEDDVAAYAGVSGDRNPVHLDDAFSRGTGGFQRGRVVHGMLVASLFPALIASHFVRSFPPPLFAIPPNSWWAWRLVVGIPPRSDLCFFVQPGAVYASQSLKFAAPVYVGDEVVAQVQALHIKATGARHIVKFATKCFMDDEETLVIDGEAMAFLPTLQLSVEAIE
ncbi:(R)-specific enoyl-CoA hydratase [Hordeum vulgare]|nr:(R)-specific enoyl-CoA hydratase [Hordeum vulgare]